MLGLKTYTTISGFKVYAVCVPVCVPNEISDPLEMELQAVVSHLYWVLGTKLKPFGRAANSLTTESFFLPICLVWERIVPMPQ